MGLLSPDVMAVRSTGEPIRVFLPVIFVPPSQISFVTKSNWMPITIRVSLVNSDLTGLQHMFNIDWLAVPPGTPSPITNKVDWSPDGEKLVFDGEAVENQGVHEIYVVNANGTGLAQLTNTYDHETDAQWSPDGTKIIFDVFGFGVYTNYGIYMINPDGSNKNRLTDFPSESPRWSPDGSKIAFAAGSFPDAFHYPDYDDVYVMNSDGSGVTNLAQDPAIDVLGGWSPDGTKIVIASKRDGDRFQIYTVNVDNTNLVKLTNATMSAEYPRWSPDGSKIALIYDGGLYIMNPDGSGLTLLRAGTINQLAWSPDGREIAFVSNYSILNVINSDGTGYRSFTNGDELISYVTWRPR
jgi:Tol biopolymer transport system component